MGLRTLLGGLLGLDQYKPHLGLRGERVPTREQEPGWFDDVHHDAVASLQHNAGGRETAEMGMAAAMHGVILRESVEQASPVAGVSNSGPNHPHPVPVDSEADAHEL